MKRTNRFNNNTENMRVQGMKNEITQNYRFDDEGEHVCGFLKKAQFIEENHWGAFKDHDDRIDPHWDNERLYND